MDTRLGSICENLVIARIPITFASPCGSAQAAGIEQLEQATIHDAKEIYQMIRKSSMRHVVAGAAVLAMFSACRVQAQVFSVHLDAFNSPAFTNTLGTFSFSYFGTAAGDAVTLSTGVVDSGVLLDLGATTAIGSAPTNTNSPSFVTGTVDSLLTLNGISRTLSFTFSLDATSFTPRYPSLSAGPPVLFDFGSQQVTVTPAVVNFPGTSINLRGANFLLKTNSVVPEPGSAALLIALGLPAAMLYRRRRRT